MKKSWNLLVIVVFLIIFFTSCSHEIEDVSEYSLQDLTLNHIEIEIGEITMDAGDEGVAEIVVTIPDFSEMIIEGEDEKAYEKSLKEILVSKDCPMTTIETTASVVFNDEGEQIVQTDALVAELLETELIEAINKAYEVESK